RIVMVRTLVVLALLGGTGYVVYAWASSGPESPVDGAGKTVKDRGRREPPDKPLPPEKPTPPEFAPRAKLGQTRAVAVARDDRLAEPLTIPEARVGIIHTHPVSSSRPGPILFLGKEVPNRDGVDDVDRIPLDLPFLAIQTTEQEQKRLGVQAYRVPGDN